MFKIGQKVVCVAPIAMLKKGEIYTCGGEDPDCKGEIQILECGVAPNGKYYCAAARRFRPLVDDNFAEELLAKIKEEVQSEFQLN